MPRRYRSSSYERIARENREDLERARRRGAQAAAEGEPINVCPYPDTSAGRFTTKYDHMARLHRAWISGWKAKADEIN